MGNESLGGVAGGADSEKTSSLEFNVGLGFKMQRTESNISKRMMVMPHPPPPPPHHLQQQSSSEISFDGGGGTGDVCGSGGGGGGGGGGGPVYSIASNQVAYVRDIYGAVGAGSVSYSGGAVLPMTLHPFATDSTFRPSASGGAIQGSGKVVPFTAPQWQELERQTMVYKCMMASIPVPPELLIPITRSPSHFSVSQSNTSTLDLRFSSSSDPEPWRCKRTDGKKWRCSRDVVPDQKYCERHAHKNRPRSRKPVEVQSHKTTTNNNNQLILPANSNTITQPLQNSISHFPRVVSATTYDEPRCTEWIMKGGSIPVSTSNQQWQQLMQGSSGGKLNRENMDHYKIVSSLQYEGEQEAISLNPCLVNASGCRLGKQHLNDQCSPLYNPKVACFQENLNAGGIQTTRHFIDAWSTAQREEENEIRNKRSESSSGKLPLSSLTLSMSGWDAADEVDGHTQMGVGMMDPDRENGVLNSRWLNPAPWMNSHPGGPLGEALCLGIASTGKPASNLPSPHGNSYGTASSSHSKSSSDDIRSVIR